MTTRYLDPTNDVAFKKIFSDQEILKNFLNGILHLEGTSRIIELEYISKEEIPDIGQGKRSIFDIKVVDGNRCKYIVEMQNSPEPSFLNRVQLYASHSYVSQSRQGDIHNQELMPIIVLVISKKTLFPRDVSCISYHDTIENITKKRYLFALRYVFVELTKFKKNPDDLETIEDYWLYYLSGSEETKAPPPSAKDEQVLRAYGVIERFNWSEEQYDAYFRAKLILAAEEEKFADSYSRGKAEGEAKGKSEGIEIGEAKGKAEGEKSKAVAIAQKMLSKGSSIEEIIEITGLSKEEISGK
jgi:predicted transposase/invertase (TIGR01784 family)